MTLTSQRLTLTLAQILNIRAKFNKKISGLLLFEKSCTYDANERTDQPTNQQTNTPDRNNRGGATPGPGRSCALPLKNWDLTLGPACEISMKYTCKA